MYNKDSNFCSEEDYAEQLNCEKINPFCKERSSIDYYNWERGYNENEIKCRCMNQDHVSVEDFCEICVAYI